MIGKEIWGQNVGGTSGACAMIGKKIWGQNVGGTSGAESEEVKHLVPTN